MGVVRALWLVWMRCFLVLVELVLEIEMDFYRVYVECWGILVEEFESECTVLVTDVYCDFLLCTAVFGDFGELAVVLVPCMWGYVEIG